MGDLKGLQADQTSQYGSVVCGSAISVLDFSDF